MSFTTVIDPETGQPVDVDFRRWLSITWTDIVAHPDPEERRKHRAAGTGVDYAEGIRLTDPRRMAVYFAKYGTAGSKDYQHHVPREWLTSVLICDECGREYPEDRDECPDCGCFDAELIDTGGGPGRFWGYRGLRPVLAIRQVTPAIGIAAGRVLRRWYRAKGLTKHVRRYRIDKATGRVTYRNTTVRKRLFRNNRGFVVVNDAPAMVSQLARYLTRSSADSPVPRSCSSSALASLASARGPAVVDDLTDPASSPLRVFVLPHGDSRARSSRRKRPQPGRK